MTVGEPVVGAAVVCLRDGTRVGLIVGELLVGAVVVCLRDGARVGLIGVRGVGLLVKVIVGPLVGLYEGFDVGFEVGEREDGRIVGFLERETVGFKLVGR